MDDQITGKIRQLDDAISRYIRPDTFPLAIRMIRPGEALPHAPPSRHRPPGVAATGANPRHSNTCSFEHRFVPKSSPFADEFEVTPGV